MEIELDGEAGARSSTREQMSALVALIACGAIFLVMIAA